METFAPRQFACLLLYSAVTRAILAHPSPWPIIQGGFAVSSHDPSWLVLRTVKGSEDVAFKLYCSHQTEMLSIWGATNNINGGSIFFKTPQHQRYQDFKIKAAKWNTLWLLCTWKGITWLNGMPYTVWFNGFISTTQQWGRKGESFELQQY